MKNPPVARLLALSRRIFSHCRIALARATGAEIASGCVLGQGTDLYLGIHSPRAGRIALNAGCELCQGVVLHPYGGAIVLGRGVYIGPHTVVFGHGTVEIGDDTLVAMHCRILSSNHTIAPVGTDIRTQPDIPLPTRIGRDVWLGAGVTVLGGVTIGDGCVVGAGSVVTRDLPPGAVAVGVPARIVGSRDQPS